jgi:spermidine synthase
MKPFEKLAETTAPNGSRFSLHRHDGDYFLKQDGRQLMSSTSTNSELMLAELACEFPPGAKAPTILIGGLGLGFSLRRVIEIAGPGARVEVAELLPDVVAWNRELLADLNGALLDLPNVTVFVEDVFGRMRRAGKGHYDAILLDVDNGPTSFVQPQNARIYGRSGLDLLRTALKPGGRVAFWSADREPAFARTLAAARFRVTEVASKAHPRAKRAAHFIYVGAV